MSAVLWDMDGTLVDTEPYWMATEHAIAEANGGTWTHEDAMQLVGNDLLVSGRYIKDKLHLDESPEEVVEMLLDGVVRQVEESVPWCPGARELLLALQREGLRLVVATSASDEELDALLRQAGVRDLVDAATTSSDAAHSKPDPDIVQAALRRSGAAPGEALMVGDTPYDIDAARAAGVRTVALRCGGWWSDADLAGAVAIRDDPTDLAQPVEEVTDEDVLAQEVDVAARVGHENDVQRAVADHLVGDLQATALGVPDVALGRHGPSLGLCAAGQQDTGQPISALGSRLMNAVIISEVVIRPATTSSTCSAIGASMPAFSARARIEEHDFAPSATCRVEA